MRATVSALALLAACTGGPGRAGGGVWELNVDTTRSGAGGDVGRTAWLRALGKEGAQGEPRTNEVILSFDCRADETGTRILTQQALRQGTVEIQLTLDAEPPRKIPGFAGTTPSGGQLVLTIPLDSVLALLRNHRRATIDYADGAGSSRTTAAFTLAGLEAYREPFLAACAGRGGAGK
jgi:hypothetical protein